MIKAHIQIPSGYAILRKDKPVKPTDMVLMLNAGTSEAFWAPIGETALLGHPNELQVHARDFAGPVLFKLNKKTQ
jgi:hypothetical protein